MRLARTLDPVEIRVMGCLLEKQQTTPEYYPLTLNALVAACNQKSNRDPTMELAPGDVREALGRLRAEVLVWPVGGSRVDRFEHNADRVWELDAPAKAIITELLVRGPQTPGELRGRGERMFPFRSPAEVEESLRRLASGVEPLVVELARAPGHKETRWAHLIGGPVESTPAGAVTTPSRGATSELAERVARLEARVTSLAGQIEALLARLGD